VSGTKTAPERRAGELTARELLRWSWRQLTSMRTALILLLVLALAAIPGSVIPQESVDALGTSRWKEDHQTLAPIYERLSLFSVYESAWFSAIYILLVISLVGCILPRTYHYWRGIRAQPPAAPRNLSRLPDHASYQTSEPVDEVLARARGVLKRGHRLRADDPEHPDDAVSAERGYLREVGNLVFHLSVLVVLVGFAMGGLFGYKGAVIVVQGGGFANSPNQYDDFAPGRLFTLEDMDSFSFGVEDFDVEWLTSGPRAGMARAFNADLSYREGLDGPQQRYDLRVNHPLKIGGTELFLVGHGYAPVITVRDGNGDVAYSGPTIFLPQDASFLSFGVVKAPDAQPAGIGLEGLFYPTFYTTTEGDPATLMGDDNNPLLSMLVYSGDLSMDSGPSQSVYVLDKSRADQVTKADGKPFRLDIAPGQTVQLPDGLGSVTFESVEPWVRIQISKSPGQYLALGGISLALLGLLGSLFIRPRRVWVRARRVDDGEGGVTMVDVAALDRSGGGDVTDVLTELEARLRPAEPDDKERP
jgi:cytochrome c biogenesis protein